MSTEIGEGYIKISADASGFDSDLSSKVGGAAEKGGKDGGNKFTRGFGSIVKKGVLGVAGVAAAGLAGVIGTAAAKGFSRIQGIEQAKAKLDGLGHSAESVQTIMDDALAAVKGTAFGLGDAAAVAASAVASGVKPGQELQRTLKLMGDSATIAGTDLSEMGLIFNKVAATGKVQGEVIQQLGERGIPILQLLGDQLGKTPEEVSKLAAAGKIGFAEFQDAMEKGLGGAALKSGATFKGAMANTMAALGRLGAVFVEPAFEGIKTVLNALIPTIDLVTSAAKPMGEAFGKTVTEGATKAAAGLEGLVTFAKDFASGWSMAPEQVYRMGDALSDTAQKAAGYRAAFDKIKGAIEGAMDAAQAAVARAAGQINEWLGGTALGGVLGLKSTLSGMWADAFAGLKAALDQATAWISEFTGGFLEGFGGLDSFIQTIKDLVPLVTGPLGLVKTAILDNLDIGAILGGLSFDPGAAGETFGEFLRPILEGIGEVSALIVGGLSSIVAAIIPVVADIAAAVGPPLLDLFGSIGSTLGNLGEAILPTLSTMIGTISSVVSYAVEAIGPLVSNLAAKLFPAIQGIVDKVGPKLVTFFEKMGDLWAALEPVLKVLVDALVVTLAPAFEQVGRVVEAVFTFIGDIIGNAIDMISGWIDVFVGILTGDWARAWEGLQAVVEGFGAQLQAALGFIADLILSIFGTSMGELQAFFTGLWDSISSGAIAAWDGITSWLSNTWTAIVDWATSTWTGLVTFFEGVWASVSATAVSAWGSFTSWISGLWSSTVATAQVIWSGLSSYLSGLWSSIQGTAESIWNGLVSFVTGIPGKVMAGLQALSQLGAKAREWFNGFVTGAKEKFTEAVNFVKEIPGKIVAALSGAGSSLVNSGKSMIDGFTSGIRQGFDNAVAAARSGLQRVRDFFPFSPAKKGPFSGKGYTTHSGKKLLEDFGVGITKGQSTAVTAAQKAAAAVAKGLKGTKATSAKATIKAAEDFDKASSKLVSQIETLQKNMTNLMRKDFGVATVLGTSKTAASMLDKVTSEILKVSTPVTQKLANYIAGERVKLDALLKSREAIAVKISDANKRLNDLVKEKANYVERLYEQTYDTSAILREGASAQGMINQLTAQVNATKKFREDLAKLGKMGLSQDLVEQLAQAGTKAGGAAAASILKGGPGAIKELNSLTGQLSNEAKKLSSSMGSQMFDAGIQATKGLVAGLTKQQSEVAKAAGQLANLIAKTIKDTLKIKSPSKVIASLGEWAGKGLPEGMFRTVDETLRASRALAEAAVPPVAPYQYAGASRGPQGAADGAVSTFTEGGNVFHVTIPLPEEVARDASLFFKWLSGLPSNVFKQKGRSTTWRR